MTVFLKLTYWCNGQTMSIIQPFSSCVPGISEHDDAVGNLYSQAKCLTDCNIFSVFPNPTNNIVSITRDNSANISIPGIEGSIETTFDVTVRNATGQVVKALSRTAIVGNGILLNMESFSPGVYFISITSADGTYSESKRIIRM